MTMTMFSKAATRVAMLALCTTALSAVPLMAQDSATPPPPPAQGEHGRPGMARMQEHHLEMMTKELNLTPDQVTQIKGIQADTNKEMLALRDDTSTAQADKREKMMSIHKESLDKVRSVLTDDQKTKFEAMQAKMREHREEHRDGNGAGPPPPPQ